MEKVTINWIKRTPRTSANGKPYTSLSLKTKEHGDRYLNGFGNKDNESWKEGDVVEITIKEVEKDGKTYLNFETPKKEDKNTEAIMIKLGLINAKLDVIYGLLRPKTESRTTDYPDEEIDINNIPF